MTEIDNDTTEGDSNRARPIGRILRFIKAGFVTAVVTPYYLATSWQADLKLVAALSDTLDRWTIVPHGGSTAAHASLSEGLEASDRPLSSA